MTWFKTAWRRFFVWVASWFGELEREEPKPQFAVQTLLVEHRPREEFDADAQELISLCASIREQRNSQTQPSVQRLSPEEYRRMLEEQMQESPSIPSGIHRSASFKFCTDQLAADARAKRLTLRVEK